MDRKTLILLMVDEANRGQTDVGRTLLQKLGYFVNEFRGLGIHYRPHYFGPYSDDLAASLNSAVAIELVQESCDTFRSLNEQPFEGVRYEYKLSEGGRTVLNKQMEDLGSHGGKIRETVRKVLETEDDYRSLSVAAKLRHILRRESESKANLAPEAVTQRAMNLGWQLPEESIKKGAGVLIKLLEAQNKARTSATRTAG